MKVRVGDFVMSWFEIYIVTKVEGDSIYCEEISWDASKNILSFGNNDGFPVKYERICKRLNDQYESKPNTCYHEAINDLIKKVFTYMKRS